MIRRATINDVDEINNLGNKLHNNFNRLFHIETELNNESSILLVNEDNNKVNGYIYALESIDNMDLVSIVVDNNYRCQHIGTKLLEELKKLSNGRTITLEVSSKNIEAINLYIKNDFKSIYVRKNYYESSDAIIMKWGK